MGMLHERPSFAIPANVASYFVPVLQRQEQKRRLSVADFDVTPPDFDVADEGEHRVDASRRRQLVVAADETAGKLNNSIVKIRFNRIDGVRW